MAVNYTALLAKVSAMKSIHKTREFATHLPNDSPYSCRYAIILHLIEERQLVCEVTNTGRKRGSTLPASTAVTVPLPGNEGELKLSRIWIWRKQRKQKFEGRTEKDALCSFHSTQFPIHFIGDRGATDEREVAGFGVEWRERKHT